MLFNSPEFMTLLLLTVALYYALPSLRLPLLAVASMLFYAVSGPGFLVLFLVVSWISYRLAREFATARGKALFILALVLNIANLILFKYSLFMTQNVERLLGIQWPVIDQLISQLILPLGISFYTFQLISYLVDVRQQRISPCRNFLLFWVYMSFFAKLVAGPIMRGQELLPQLAKVQQHRFSLPEFKYGVYLIILGLSKKLLIADNLAAYVETLFTPAALTNGAQSWAAAYLYTFQLYFDFSAYSDMAVGVGYLFGVKLVQNFVTPYVSANITEFWKRWHISLSKWIQDYIYIPLGGSRKGTLRQYVNLFLAMGISGLWHGAAWTFVAWGLLHGALLVGHKLYLDIKKRLLPQSLGESLGYRLLCVAVFFHIICITWVFFRAGSLTLAVAMTKSMLNPATLGQLSGFTMYFGLVLGLYLLHLIEHFCRKNEGKLADLWHRVVPAPLRGMSYTLLICVLLLAVKTQATGFIYFRF
ncbi:MBOAT family O-acyltransferase [Desulforamulus aeronauticus]|uniref:D-alanyl-lipoteichoic acid acyltransferase DltB, MBOAT superfamily n=1 Tax=Desulforamulus aeronauticus DSM 10349 TaxID=1121421 RepID=A0A1M6V6D0_9FIRM|nr:MBOAT family O-acyltransferase [Desulforamulus aeronauticus]SHK77027.1 D-alanyl-lipoteichoic acid acyltransferase DltB, MBOAT superfamily [Desulforamulus aeronauticus DSM 10349]